MDWPEGDRRGQSVILAVFEWMPIRRRSNFEQWLARVESSSPGRSELAGGLSTNERESQTDLFRGPDFTTSRSRAVKYAKRYSGRQPIWPSAARWIVSGSFDERDLFRH